MQRTDAWPFKQAEKTLSEVQKTEKTLSEVQNTMQKTEKTLSEVQNSLKMWIDFLRPLDLQHVNKRLEKLETSNSPNSTVSSEITQRLDTLEKMVGDMKWTLVADEFNHTIRQQTMVVGFTVSPPVTRNSKQKIKSIQWEEYNISNTTKTEVYRNDGQQRVQKIVNMDMLSKWTNNTSSMSTAQFRHLIITKVTGKYSVNTEISYNSQPVWEYWITASGFQKEFPIFVPNGRWRDFENVTQLILKINHARSGASQMNFLNV